MNRETQFDEMSEYEDPSSFTETNFYEKFRKKIDQGRHIILYGPPGTGKTRLVSELLNSTSELGVRELVQFHPQFSYQDFVEGYSVNQGQFDYKPGVFLRFIDAIRRSTAGKKNILVIDEINRADISSVFGEVMTFLDDPLHKKVTLPVSGRVLESDVPFCLIGTMNSADKNIAIMDFALRRRFDFIFVQPDYIGMTEWLCSHGFDFTDFSIPQYVDFARKINDRIIQHPMLGKNMTLGQALYVPKKVQGAPLELEDICDAVTDKVIPQIEAYLGMGNSMDLATLLSPDLMRRLQLGQEIPSQLVIDLIVSIAPSARD
jgi:5-methylcytosine-specific restriction enzyme B